MLNWDDIDTVLLDMDGTLLDLHFDNYFWLQHVPRAYAQRHQTSEALATKTLHHRFRQEQGTLNWYSVDYWSEQLDLDIAALKQQLKHLIVIRPHVEEFLQQLQRSHRQVVMVTNAHRKALDIKMAEVDLLPWFDRIVVSHDLKAAKEEQDFWHRLQAVHAFDPERTLLIDDTESVLHSAHQYGIGHLLTLLQPDSQGPKRETTHFRSIHHFDEVMPEDSPQ